MGSATGAIGVVALGELENEARAAASGQDAAGLDAAGLDQGLEAKPKGLRVGMLTAPFGDKRWWTSSTSLRRPVLLVSKWWPIPAANTLTP